MYEQRSIQDDLPCWSSLLELAYSSSFSRHWSPIRNWCILEMWFFCIDGFHWDDWSGWIQDGMFSSESLTVHHEVRSECEGLQRSGLLTWNLLTCTQNVQQPSKSHHSWETGSGMHIDRRLKLGPKNFQLDLPQWQCIFLSALRHFAKWHTTVGLAMRPTSRAADQLQTKTSSRSRGASWQ